MSDIADRLWGKAVLAKWNYTCAICGKKATDPHHLVPRQFTATRYDVENGIGLCQHDHIWNPHLSPHQNPAAFLAWLNINQHELWIRYTSDPRPEFDGITNVAFYCETILRLRQHVDPAEFERIVGKKFSRYLIEDDGRGET